MPDAEAAARSEPTPAEIEAAILGLLEARSVGATVCPSEAARHLRPDGWRPLMDPVRSAARRLAARGELEITQRGRVVDPERARGAIRLRRRFAG